MLLKNTAEGKFTMFNLDITYASSSKEIKAAISVMLNRYDALFPVSKKAKILLKPNLNANMSALTGNTTDLRLLVAVIEYFQSKGYKNITIAEGTNSGFYRHHISVISRLRVDRLANYYGIHVVDLNYSEPVDIEFEAGVKAGVGRECLDADLFINMPKLKTHFEAGMSVCLKNLMGCLVGQENKKKTHQSLAANILHINNNLKPHLHIVDAVISMEGMGPTCGTPVQTGMILIGTDPYLIDLMCARSVSFDYRKVRTLMEAEKRGILHSAYHHFVNGYSLKNIFHFKPPKPGPIAGFIHHPERQKYFLAIRNKPLFHYLCSTRIGGKILYLTGLRQDVFIEEEMECEGLSLNTERCLGCGKCTEYCPMGLDVPDALVSMKDNCIHCLYCFCVCPEHAIEFKGKFGFMEEQLKQYDHITRSVT
jgi:uncharacterized protein (DUF362 family)/NAD-dependent dihydropyrimidine dehydrogenase PreA subunit